MSACSCETNGLPVLRKQPVLDNSTGKLQKTLCSVNVMVPVWYFPNGISLPASVTTNSEGQKELRIVLNLTEDLSGGTPLLTKAINYQFELIEADLEDVPGYDDNTNIVFVPGTVGSDGTEMPVSTTSRVSCCCCEHGSRGWRCWCYSDVFKGGWWVEVLNQ